MAGLASSTDFVSCLEMARDARLLRNEMSAASLTLLQLNNLRRKALVILGEPAPNRASLRDGICIFERCRRYQVINRAVWTFNDNGRVDR